VANLSKSTEAERLVIQRVGQVLFRDRLMTCWQGRCPPDPRWIEFSHLRRDRPENALGGRFAVNPTTFARNARLSGGINVHRIERLYDNSSCFALATQRALPQTTVYIGFVDPLETGHDLAHISRHKARVNGRVGR